MFYIDPLYILISLPALLLSSIAFLLIRIFYTKYSKIPNSYNLTGIDVSEKIARFHDLNLRVNLSFYDLSDNYNPVNKTLTLSEKVARTPSIASVGIAAHEMGHVLQHKNAAVLMGIRNLMVPVVNIGTTLGYLLFILGFSLQITGLLTVGLILFSSATLFTIITLPIEIDASMKALKMIKQLDLLPQTEISGVKKVLSAAALTYIAAVLQSLSSLLYYILRAFGVKRE